MKATQIGTHLTELSLQKGFWGQEVLCNLGPLRVHSAGLMTIFSIFIAGR
jgi:hypothetical protein